MTAAAHGPDAGPAWCLTRLALYCPAMYCLVLQPEGETNPLKFSQTFHLAPVGGSYVVTNGEPPASQAPASWQPGTC